VVVVVDDKKISVLEVEVGRKEVPAGNASQTSDRGESEWDPWSVTNAR
jgi:hypothetical protein